MKEAHNDDATRALMQNLAVTVEKYLAGMSIDGEAPAFTVLIWPDGKPGNRVNYVSNVPRSRRDEIRSAMVAVQRRWRGMIHRRP